VDYSGNPPMVVVVCKQALVTLGLLLL
jgi:hypothetical protein